jgi:hypothetical protein
LLALERGEQEVVPAKAEEEKKVVRREEKLEEIRARKQAYGRGKMGRRFAGGFPNNNFNGGDPVPQESTEDQFDKINGEKVLREYGPNGLRNAIHFIVMKPAKIMVEYLLSLNICPDTPDYDEMTPFNVLSQTQINNLDPDQQALIDKFLKLEIRIDYPNRKGRTPFLNFYEKQNFELAYKMIELGANVNQMDQSGLFALKYALIRR